MKLPIVGRGVPSALFVFITKEGEYDLIRGTNGSGLLVQSVVEVISRKMLTSTWVYIDYLIRAEYDKPGTCKAQNLFEVPIKQAPISGFTNDVCLRPETFFKENDPGLVVAPFAAINLGEFIEVIIVVRDRETPVYSDDVMKSLQFFVKEEEGESPLILPEFAQRMSKRVGTSIDSGVIEVDGKKMYVSVGGKSKETIVVPSKSFSVKRKVVPEKPSTHTSSFPFWPTASSE